MNQSTRLSFPDPLLILPCGGLFFVTPDFPPHTWSIVILLWIPFVTPPMPLDLRPSATLFLRGTDPPPKARDIHIMTGKQPSPSSPATPIPTITASIKFPPLRLTVATPFSFPLIPKVNICLFLCVVPPRPFRRGVSRSTDFNTARLSPQKSPSTVSVSFSSLKATTSPA